MDTQYKKDVEYLVGQLSEIEGLQYVFFNGIALPSQPANLIAKNDAFKSALFSNRTLSKNDLNKSERLAKDANSFARQLLAEQNKKSKGPKFVYVDMAKVLERYDFKGCIRHFDMATCRKEKSLVLGKGRFAKGTDAIYLDNRPLKLSGKAKWTTGAQFARNIEEGGLFSFDNMHPSSVGYQLMTKAVLTEMLKPENGGLDFPKPQSNKCQSQGSPDGACREVMIVPGWALADATRRETEFLRNGGRWNYVQRAWFAFLANLVGAFD